MRPDSWDLKWPGKTQGRPASGALNSLGFAAFPLEEEVVNRSDQRAMGKSMQAAVFAAGRALGAAGLKGQAELLADTQILTAGRCAERDDDLDDRLLASVPLPTASKATLALRMGLRPSLFLAQLPNLISANISIVHGVTGCSQTFLGEEGAGIEAIATAYERIAHGMAERCLVGGVFSGANGSITAAAAGADLARRPERLTSLAAFLVLESDASARRRDHRAGVSLDRHLRFSTENRVHNRNEVAFERVWEAIGGAAGAMVVTSSRGDARSNQAEDAVLAERSHNESRGEVRRLHAAFGTALEAAAPSALAFAVGALDDVQESSSEPPRAVVLNISSEGGGSIIVLEKLYG